MLKIKILNCFLKLAILFYFCLFGFINVSFAGTVDISEIDNFNLIKKVFNLIKNEYVKKDIMDEKLLYGAINGMLSALDDPYSRYLDPENFKEMQADTNGEFEGVGVVISTHDKVLTVIAPIDNTPAYNAGIKAGDKILKIDGVDTDKLTVHDAINKMRGKKGTKITLTIWRPGFEEPRDFIITRDVIPFKTVKGKMVDDEIGYIRISQFTETTASDLDKALNELLALNMKSLILDLRDNPGGLLTAAIDVARKFIDNGIIVTVKSRDGKTLNLSSYYKSYPNFPLVVLINKGSASSSEIVAGAIKDNARGILIGNKTFGKGVIQTVIPMENNSGLILTTAWYFTPSGKSIHEVGIEPNITIDQTLLTSDELSNLYELPGSSSSLSNVDMLNKNLENINLSKETIKKYNLNVSDIQLIKAIELLKCEFLASIVVYDNSNSNIKKNIAINNISKIKEK